MSTKRTTDLDIADLELLHHFTTVVSLLMAHHGRPDAHALWQIYAVKLGFKHEFLLRGVLAVSAYHLSYMLPEQKASYELKASTHQSIALESFQSALSRADESNCHALFAFSVMIVIMAFASPRKEDPQTEILHWFHLMRGCQDVLLLHWDLMRKSFLSPLIDEMSYTETCPAHLVKDSDRITDLLSTCCTPDQNREISQAYALAIHELLKTFIQSSLLRSRGEGSILASFVWPLNLSPKYLELLGEHRPEAMVILAHYCVLLHWGEEEGEWFLKGWSSYTLDTIKASVGESWHTSLAWPEAVIASDTPSYPEYTVSAARRQALDTSLLLMRQR